MPTSRDLSELTESMNESSWQAEFVRELAENYCHLYACALTVVGNRDDANDVIQEVCVVLWKKKCEEVEEILNFRKWACSITFILAKAHVRQRRRHHGMGFNDEALARIVQARSAGSELFELRRDVLRGCLAKLAVEDRKLLFDCYQDDVSLLEVAKRKGRTATAIYSKLKRLRQQLSACIQRQLGKGDDW